VSTQPGLRERKKQQTRATIAAAAVELFASRGFESVKVAEIAVRSNVSEATVFNYFPTKEDLIYSRLGDLRADLLERIRSRDRSQTISAAFREFLLSQRPPGQTPEELEALVTLTRIINESPSLLAREREINSRNTRELAALIAEDVEAAPDDITPWVVANALMGVHMALIGYTREQMLAGVSGSTLERGIRDQAAQAFDALADGLAAYPGGR
jgi:AcrR family transcriptional regulator